MTAEDLKKEKVKELSELLEGLNVSHVADNIGVHRVTIYRYRSGDFDNLYQYDLLINMVKGYIEDLCERIKNEK